MGKRVRNLAISIITVAISLFVISGPVFATSNSINNTSYSALTTFATSTTDDDQDDQESSQEEQTDEETEDNSTCYDQVGGIGWLVCPGTSFLANIIDGAYDILETLIKVDPISTDTDSPIHVVWEYLRNITNAIFIIFLLIVIYSQITGFGINNYGIKRVLPRIIVSAILVNLSFIICILAVDLSNILGAAFRGLFANIQEQAIANSTISEAAAGTSVAAIVSTILGVGVVGAVVVPAITGGWAGLIWLLIPVVLSGAIAIISAVVTMAARQALILLLVMISPMAFVAYLLPNTEKWFQKWYHLFMRMLFFYPMFSILYGASQLAGLVMISSATNWLGVVLGIAVEVLPLFMSVPLMRMSGTMLGRIDGLIHRAGAPLHGATMRYSAERQNLARQRKLASTNYLPSTRLAQYLEQRRLNRKIDTEKAFDTGHKERLAKYERSQYDRNNRLNRRGMSNLNYMQRSLTAGNVITASQIDFDEGFGDDGSDSRVRTRDLNRMRNINSGFVRGVDMAAINKARQEAVSLENTRSRAERIREGVKDEQSQIHRQITSAFNLRNSSSDPNEQLAIQRSINATLSNAITDSRKINKAAYDSYYELYDDMEAGNGPQTKLIEAFDQTDANSMSAAIAVMAKRGDFKDIEETLFDHSHKIQGDLRMQKQLNDALIKLKADDQNLWAYAKANMIRRGMYTTDTSKGDPTRLDPYIDFKSFIRGDHLAGDVNQAAWKITSLDKILEDVKGAGTTATQDRTVFKSMLSFMKKGELSVVNANGDPNLHIPMKYLRSAAVSGMMDGEQLATLNQYLTFGFDPNATTQDAFFTANQNIVAQNIESFFRDMSASQLVSIKSSTFKSLNSAMLTIDPASGVDMNGKQVSQRIIDILQDRKTLDAVNRDNFSARAGMNPEVREMLGVRLD